MIHSDQLSPAEVRARKWAAILSAVVGTLLLFAKFWAYNLTHSQGVYSDAMESIVNVATGLFSLFVIYYSAQPKDQNHPYGHGKIEYFSAAFEGGLIFFAATFILFEATQAIYEGRQLLELSTGTVILALAGVSNCILGLFLKRVGQRYRSNALIASGEHVLSDFWTSAAIIVALILIQITGEQWIDIVAAYLAGLYLAYTGFHVVRESISGLMDEEDLTVLKELADVFNRHMGDGIIQIHYVRIIRSGWYHHIDAHLIVPEFWRIDETHERLDRFENSFIQDYSYGGDANFHLDPCRRAYCDTCDLPNCPVRQKPFVAKRVITVDELRSPIEPRPRQKPPTAPSPRES
ncbi:MAG: cation diffusion facilitator family transporter [Bdellovibrionota bacterium]